jgi:hypothetical protein
MLIWSSREFGGRLAFRGDKGLAPSRDWASNGFPFPASIPETPFWLLYSDFLTSNLATDP